MLTFIARRLGAGLVLLIVIPTIAFNLMYLSGTDIARNILGQVATEQQVADKAAALGLDRPVFVQYLDWLGNALRGDFGSSWFTNEPVLSAVTARLPVTLTIVIGTTILAAVIAVAIGVASAVYGGVLDRIVQILAIAGFALPGFWLALMFVLVFSINLGWFPATGFVPFGTSPVEWLRSITLPIAALCVGAVAAVAQQVRGAMLDVLRQDYITTLRSRGLPAWRVVLLHALRNASGAGLTVLALQFVGLMGGAVFVERIFALPGIGLLTVNSSTQGDVPMVMGVVVVMTIVVVIVNLVIDTLAGILNPKVRVA